MKFSTASWTESSSIKKECPWLTSKKAAAISLTLPAVSQCGVRYHTRAFPAVAMLHAAQRKRPNVGYTGGGFTWGTNVVRNLAPHLSQSTMKAL